MALQEVDKIINTEELKNTIFTEEDLEQGILENETLLYNDIFDPFGEGYRVFLVNLKQDFCNKTLFDPIKEVTEAESGPYWTKKWHLPWWGENFTMRWFWLYTGDSPEEDDYWPFNLYGNGHDSARLWIVDKNSQGNITLTHIKNTGQLLNKGIESWESVSTSAEFIIQNRNDISDTYCPSKKEILEYDVSLYKYAPKDNIDLSKKWFLLYRNEANFEACNNGCIWSSKDNTDANAKNIGLQNLIEGGETLYGNTAAQQTTGGGSGGTGNLHPEPDDPTPVGEDIPFFIYWYYIRADILLENLSGYYAGNWDLQSPRENGDCYTWIPWSFNTPSDHYYIGLQDDDNPYDADNFPNFHHWEGMSESSMTKEILSNITYWNNSKQNWENPDCEWCINEGIINPDTIGRDHYSYAIIDRDKLDKITYDASKYTDNQLVKKSDIVPLLRVDSTGDTPDPDPTPEPDTFNEITLSIQHTLTNLNSTDAFSNQLYWPNIILYKQDNTALVIQKNNQSVPIIQEGTILSTNFYKMCGQLKLKTNNTNIIGEIINPIQAELWVSISLPSGGYWNSEWMRVGPTWHAAGNPPDLEACKISLKWIGNYKLKNVKKNTWIKINSNNYPSQSCTIEHLGETITIHQGDIIPVIESSESDSVQITNNEQNIKIISQYNIANNAAGHDPQSITYNYTTAPTYTTQGEEGMWYSYNNQNMPVYRGTGSLGSGEGAGWYIHPRTSSYNDKITITFTSNGIIRWPTTGVYLGTSNTAMSITSGGKTFNIHTLEVTGISSPQSGYKVNAGDSITFGISGISDAGGNIVNIGWYLWSMGDGDKDGSGWENDPLDINFNLDWYNDKDKIFRNLTTLHWTFR